MHGEASSAPLKTLSAEHIKLQEIFFHYNLEDIYNANKTATKILLENNEPSESKLGRTKLDKSKLDKNMLDENKLS
ncbi:2507_t:CDS:2 [Cetraspora pellucida]|uniref:2507_t:CDS:1 n=1 Tax=Cetraspora pellucida TaxID=1433469 RepID=A0ACA9K2L6_9GLOM|nr:2507_t:CDS:2 [Cetraspora pellucida]